jgi:hypothetical protein
MTITVPWRRMTLQLSQRALMEALTFNVSSMRQAPSGSRLLQPICDASAIQVVRRKLDPNAVPGEDSDEVHPKLARDVSQDPVAVLQLDREHRIGERFDNRSFDFDRVSLGHGR